MPLYKCNNCNKYFNKKYNYIVHKNRKIKCNERKYTLNCVYCKKAFTTKSSVTRHIKNSCKVIKQRDEERKNIFDELQKLREENKQLKEKLLEQNTNTQIINNTTNNTTNNTNNINNGTVNNITIIAHGKEDISEIGLKKILLAVSKGYSTPLKLTEAIHFNPEHPEFHNVYIPNINNSYAMIYDGKDWKLVQKSELIDELYMDKVDYVHDNLEEFCKVLSIYKIRALKRWLKSDENDESCIKKIKKDIELLLYNKRKMIVGTKKKVEKAVIVD